MNKIEHIGIAVTNLAAAGPLYEKLLNTTIYKVEEVASEKVKTAFLQNGPNKIELLEASGEDSPIAKFIAKKGEGVHHIAFDVDDIRAEMARLKAEGFVLLNDEPKRGADNKLVCFVHPKSAGGVLVELCESIKKDDVLSQYGIRFYQRQFSGNGRYYDHLDSINDALTCFLIDYNAPMLVNDFIISYINSVRHGYVAEETIISQGLVSVIIDKDNSKFYQNPDYLPNDAPDFSMPTPDFKKIAEEWMFYLRNNRR